MNRISFIKSIDSIIGRGAVFFCPPPAISKIPSLPRSVLFIRPGGVGDAVLLVPALRVFQTKYPETAISILAETRNADIFRLCPGIRNVFRYDAASELAAAIRGKYDVVIDTEQWHRLSAVVARATGAPMLIGYETNERKKLFSHAVSYSHEEHEIRSFLNLLTPIAGGVTDEPSVPFLSIPTGLKAETTISRWPNQGFITIFPGGSINERRWGSDRFHQTALLMSNQGYGIVVVGGTGDTRDGEIIIRGVPNSVNLCGRLSLSVTAAVLQKSALLITGDSGIMHIGYGLGIKIVALFGPGREKKWAPRGKNCRVINRHLACSPCTMFGYTPRCRNNAECMKQIMVEEVFHEAMELLDNRERR